MWRNRAERETVTAPDMPLIDRHTQRFEADGAAVIHPWPVVHDGQAGGRAAGRTGVEDGGMSDANRRLKARIVELERQLVRSELLLREANHRAKNGFATMSSLITLQLAQVADPQARAILTVTQARLAAVALVHDALQGKEAASRIDLGALLRRLAEALAFSMGAPERGVELAVDAPPVAVNAGRALSLALIVNEALTNALKYAFAGRAGGRIALVMRRRAGRVWLHVRDDGVAAGSPTHHTGSGLGLIRGLAEQAGARVRLRWRGGTCVTVAMPL